ETLRAGGRQLVRAVLGEQATGGLAGQARSGDVGFGRQGTSREGVSLPTLGGAHGPGQASRGGPRRLPRWHRRRTDCQRAGRVAGVVGAEAGGTGYASPSDRTEGGAR